VARECFVESMLYVAVFERERGYGGEGRGLVLSGFRDRDGSGLVLVVRCSQDGIENILHVLASVNSIFCTYIVDKIIPQSVVVSRHGH
jgi:hypothetical protein